MSVALRDYQADLVAATRAALRNADNKKRVLLQAPTGAGKTAIATAITELSSQRLRRVWFICHRAELVEQTSLTYTKFGVPHTFIAAGRAYDPQQLVAICSIDTLKNRVDKLSPEELPDLVLWDECHHIGAAGWSAVMAKLDRAYHVGLSATPQRLDGAGLDEHFGELIPGPTVEWLIAEGHLSRYRAFAPSKPDLKGVHTLAGDFKSSELEAVMDRPRLTGDAVQHWLEHAKGLKTVVFAVTVKHSQAIAQAFRDAGISAAHLDGSTPRAERADIIQRYARGEIDVLTNVSLFGEGFDLSAIAGVDVTIDCVMLLRPTQSLALHLQQIGRALRPAPGKVAIILDHAGNTERLGLPDDPRTWTLKGREKGKPRENDGPPPPVTCLGCFSQIRRPCPTACPYCGEALVVPKELPKMSREQLQEIKRAEREAALKAKEAAKAAKAAEKERLAKEAEEERKRKKREEWACKTRAELVELGKKRGYPYPSHWADRRAAQLHLPLR